ncbi:hypothetical protein [Wolbachia endosymbiont (group A) of Pogonocherus hispidulus]|uniref:hypothetical protein n=1 Tax=Wolbachia endosymbiont (group A) of Pogonocherus hispidulus TaxID=3066136 RepID=UPI00334083EE
MWKNIKKFFKWIADHTGISWVARKISSGWKRLFGGKASTAQQNTSQQESSSGNKKHVQANAQSKTTAPKTLNVQVNLNQTLPKQPASSKADLNEPKSGRIEVSDEKFVLAVNADRKDFMQASKNPSNSEEYLVYVKHAKGIHRITGPNMCVNPGNENELQYFAINSIATQDGKTVSGDPVEMKKMLGLEESKGFTDITGISKDPITVPKSEIASSATTPAASNGPSVSA